MRANVMVDFLVMIHNSSEDFFYHKTISNSKKLVTLDEKIWSEKYMEKTRLTRQIKPKSIF